MDVNIKVTLELPDELLELIKQAATAIIYWEQDDEDDTIDDD